MKGNSMDSLDTAEKCKHCGLRIVKRDGWNWVHAEGPQERKRTCAINPYGYDAAPHGEPCVVFCIGHEPGLRAVDA